MATLLSFATFMILPEWISGTDLEDTIDTNDMSTMRFLEDDGASAPAPSPSSSGEIRYLHLCDPAIAAIIAWCVLVITLEVNDFRHQLYLSKLSSHHPLRHIASYVAIRLGLRDALKDAIILYSIGYCIVAGFTWNHADPNALCVIWGISTIIAAWIIVNLSFKIPQWLGIYRKSQLQLIHDTSGRAAGAIYDLVEGGGFLSSLRYQARLGVATHFVKFVFILLPFYTDLKVWSFAFSVLVGLIFGLLFLHVVSSARKRFKQNRARVAAGATIFLGIVSASVCFLGLYIVDIAWGWSFATRLWLLFVVSFSIWMALIGSIHGMKVWEQRHFEHRRASVNSGGAAVDCAANEETAEDDEDAQLFHDDAVEDNLRVERATLGDDGPASDDGMDKEEESSEDEKDEEGLFRRDTVDSQAADKYQSIYLNRVSLADSRSKKEPAQLAAIAEAMQDGIDKQSTPRKVYNKFVHFEEASQSEKNCFARCWNFLPFKAMWDVLSYEVRISRAGCWRAGGFAKFWFVMMRICRTVLSLLALYVAIVSCAATYQIYQTKVTLPIVRPILYDGQNDGVVCAFDDKCGDLRDFDNKEEAVLAGYSVAHCGPCAHCSSWQDLELQYSTRTFLAEKAQKCGMKTMGKSTSALQECLKEDIGWTHECAGCWAEDIVCTKKFCVFIYLQSRMTNQLGNFKVGPDTITSATCEEAFCEAGNPGEFVRCSGANRRRMNIVSDIARPKSEQCQIVDVPDWGEFFDTKCEAL